MSALQEEVEVWRVRARRLARQKKASRVGVAQDGVRHRLTSFCGLPISVIDVPALGDCLYHAVWLSASLEGVRTPFGLGPCEHVHDLRVLVAERAVQLVETGQLNAVEDPSLVIGNYIAEPSQFARYSGVVPLMAMAHMLRRTIVTISSDGITSVTPHDFLEFIGVPETEDPIVIYHCRAGSILSVVNFFERNHYAAVRCDAGTGLRWRDLAASHRISGSCDRPPTLSVHLRVVEWFMKHMGAACTSDVLEYAATSGQIEMLQFVHRHRGSVQYPHGLFDRVAGCGHLGILQWMTLMGIGHPTHRAIDDAALNGHLGAVVWLSEHLGLLCTTAAMDGAARSGHLDIVKWLHVHRSEGCTTEAMDGAALLGRLDIVEWLHKNRHEGCTTRALANAAACGSLEVVKFLHTERTEGCTTDAVDAAITFGCIRVVDWFLDNRDEGYTSEAMDSAVSSGRFEVLEYLRLAGSVGCTSNAFWYAVSNNHLYLASWVEYHYNHSFGHSQLAPLFRENGWTMDILREAFE